ncbi:mit domain-containing protein [Neofusicoccum parvum]|uniref:Mit domain-containing protein n=1 Tax=Neofusicoccum parvum TaxID=310453 RepID=A0ACB5RUV4_9PEZI|nr:mit domain-containing protein [Neofusicoccum parvum]
MHSASNAHAAAAKSSHHRKASHSNTSSLSSTSTATLKRASSLKASSANPSRPPTAPPLDPPIEDELSPDAHKKLRKRTSTHRRRSTVAHAAHDQSSSPIREGIGNLHRWSQSSTSSRASIAKELRQGSFSRRLSFSSGPPLDPLHGSALHSPQQSPTRNRSPDVSPRGKTRPYSPPPKIPTPDPAPALPLLPATTFDPSSPLTAATTNTSTPGLFTPPAALSSGPDYFSHKSYGPATSPRAKKPPPPKGFAKSPLASPPIFEPSSNRPNKPLHSASASVSSRSRAASVEQQQRSSSALGRERRAPPREQSSSRTRDRSVSGATIASEDDSRRAPSRNKDRGEKDKKTMLSRALQKANTAVLLDNAQNFEGAMEAYGDACRLLQQVMLRSSGEDDRKKLEAIRVTYTNRIQELKMLDPAWQSSGGKALPSRPMSDQSLADTQSFIDNVVDDEEEPVVIETATITRIVNDSGATEAEFDAALDAAVEAAYDDNLEPYEEESPISPYRRNVEIAKERVREAEREMAIEAAKRRDREIRMRGESLPHVRDGSVDLGGQNEDADDEERILDEMTKDYMLDDFDFGLQSKSALPRQSDSNHRIRRRFEREK